MSAQRSSAETRRARHRQWLAEGGAYGNRFRRQDEAQALQEQFRGCNRAALEAQARDTAVAGRVMLRRQMGRASFVTLQDGSGRIQCYLSRDGLGEAAYRKFLELWDIGDIVGVRGRLMRTGKGELTVRGSEATLLSKALRDWPEKFHGLADQEARYRQRYLDLAVNESVRARFRIRSKVLQEIRAFFLERDFLEVETPMMHAMPGGAVARPFVTHHNGLDMDLYLRVAPELFLKRLTIGGFERVFEINRCFRNEGLSPRHNPEFTTLEFYWAYRDYRDIMQLTEELLRRVAQNALGGTAFSCQGRRFDFGQPFAEMSLAESLVRIAGLKESQVDDEAALRGLLSRGNVPVRDGWGLGKLQMEAFEAWVERQLAQPTFIIDYPAEVSPLSRRSDQRPELADRFELFVAGQELANGFSELNDPEDQAERFRRQAAAGAAGDDEAMRFDQDYIDALEYGLPPTAGEGLGIDRLLMLLTDAPSIRDVLLFPLMRPDHYG